MQETYSSVRIQIFRQTYTRWIEFNFLRIEKKTFLDSFSFLYKNLIFLSIAKLSRWVNASWRPERILLPKIRKRRVEKTHSEYQEPMVSCYFWHMENPANCQKKTINLTENSLSFLSMRNTNYHEKRKI